MNLMIIFFIKYICSPNTDAFCKIHGAFNTGVNHKIKMCPEFRYLLHIVYIHSHSYIHI